MFKAIPHYSTEDDSYGGYFIPKGSTIIANNWYVSETRWSMHYFLPSFSRGILHDEKLYPEPYKFRPERYIDDTVKDDSKNPDPNKFAFGYGRR